jgi:hypothetical protein
MKLGSHMTDEQKARVSLGSMGRIQSPETRAKIAAGLSGKPKSLEVRAKDAASHMGKPVWNKGVPMTDEQKANNSEGHKGQVAWNRGIPRTPEVKAKLSIMQKGHVMPANTRAQIAKAVWKGGKELSTRRHTAKRRVLGFEAINPPFPGCEGHHLDNERVVHIPKTLHRSVYHNVWTGQNMDKINALAMQWVESRVTA